jgi:hypothetical protein
VTFAVLALGVAWSASNTPPIPECIRRLRLWLPLMKWRCLRVGGRLLPTHCRSGASMTLGSARAVLEAAEVPPLILISSQSPPWGRRASHHWNLTRAISRKAITERSVRSLFRSLRPMKLWFLKTSSRWGFASRSIQFLQRFCKNSEFNYTN